MTIASQGAGYTCVQSDLTPLYNSPDYWTPATGIMDILQASRTIVWLQPDHLVVYDRATSKHPGLFKRFNLHLLTQPTVSGSLLTATSAGGQSLYVETLLPAQPTSTWVAVDPSLAPAVLEPTLGHMVIEDATHPADVRFLNVLQGADPGVARTASQAFRDATGAAFDGVVLGRVAVLFPIHMGTVPAGFSWTVPATVQGNLVTGLTPGAGYDVHTASGASGVTLTLAAGTTYHADAGGVLAFGPLVP